MKTYKILLLPGDGIGPEVLAQGERILRALEAKGFAKFDISEDLIGGASIDIYGVPLTDETLAVAKTSDAVVLGAVGGPKWEKQPYNLRPEQGLLGLRLGLDLFANLRPAVTYAPLAGASSLKPEIVAGIDILFVRELTGGMYFGEPRGIYTEDDGTRTGVNTHSYTTHQIHRVARMAFELATKRSGKLCSVDKANVMEAGKLWREEVAALHTAEYLNIQLSHMYADNCAMQLVRAPKQFDVILTDNLFGDILSDEAGMLTGSLGMLPSAALGEMRADGRRAAMYEPIHGSAPDIAGKNLANPLATILSLAMMMRHTCDSPAGANALERAVVSVLEQGFRTKDIYTQDCRLVTCSEMAEAVLMAL